MGKPKKDVPWIYSDPSVRLPCYFLRSNAWKRIGNAARTLYILMRLSIGEANYNPRRVKFGPRDVVGYLSRNTYYPAMNELLTVGIVNEVQPGSHGRKPIYDLTTLKWVEAKPK